MFLWSCFAVISSIPLTESNYSILGMTLINRYKSTIIGLSSFGKIIFISPNDCRIIAGFIESY